MSTDAELAAAFYGSSTTPAKPAAETQRSADQSTADVFFKAITPVKSAPVAKDTDIQSDTQMAKALHDQSPIHCDAERAIANAAREQHLASDEDAQAAAQSWVPTMQAFELNATESKAVTDLAISATASPPSEETVHAWHQDAMSVLRQEYGSRAGEALEAAQRLVARDRAAFDLLHRTGLGSHPVVVRVAATKAMALRKAGKL